MKQEPCKEKKGSHVPHHSHSVHCDSPPCKSTPTEPIILPPQSVQRQVLKLTSSCHSSVSKSTKCMWAHLTVTKGRVRMMALRRGVRKSGCEKVKCQRSKKRKKWQLERGIFCTYANKFQLREKASIIPILLAVKNGSCDQKPGITRVTSS